MTVKLRAGNFFKNKGINNNKRHVRCAWLGFSFEKRCSLGKVIGVAALSAGADASLEAEQRVQPRLLSTRVARVQVARQPRRGNRARLGFGRSPPGLRQCF